MSDNNGNEKYIKFGIADGKIVKILVTESMRGPGFYLSFDNAALDAREAGYEEKLLTWLKKGDIPNHSKYNDFSIADILKNTIEGREFIEAVLHKYGFNWYETPKPPRKSIKNVEKVETEKGRWREEELSLTEKKKASREELFSEFIQKAEGAKSYVYVLKLLHKVGHDTAYYVGRSSSPFSRIKRHHQRQGDFSGSEKYIVVGIHRIADESKISESEMYRIVSSQTGAEVYGGK